MIEIRGNASEAIKMLSNADRIISNAYDELIDLGDTAYSQIKEDTPKKTGKLAREWELNKTEKGKAIESGLLWKVTNPNQDVLHFLEYGTKPHIIVPKNEGGVLVFNIDQQTIFSKIVRHPGTKPLAFVTRLQMAVNKLGLKILLKAWVKLKG